MLLEVATLYIVLSAACPNSGSGEGDVAVVNSTSDKVTLIVANPSHIAPIIARDLEAAMAEDFSLVPEVLRVSVERAEGNLLVWLAANRPSPEVRERIFRKQFAIIEAFPEVSFDFNLISLTSDEVGEFASSAKAIFTREK